MAYLALSPLKRADLLETADLSPEEQKWLDGFSQGRVPSDYVS